MPLVPVQMAPGMLRNSTEYASKGRWVDGNWVRWWRGALRPIGGWSEIPNDVVPISIFGTCRSLHSWRDLSLAPRLVMATHRGLYAYNGTSWTDITYAGFSDGPVNGGLAEGYGGGGYDVSSYGTARAFSFTTEASANWTLDNYGENLIACANWDGTIYQWAPGDPAALFIEDPSTGTEVPQLCEGVFVTNERHVVAVGAGFYNGASWERDGRRVAWSDQEDPTTWTPTVTNAAGDLQLQSDSVAVCGTRFNKDNLIWTESDVHLMRYVGPPYFYGIERIANNAGIVGSSAYTITNRFALWVSKDAIMIYDGSVKELSPEVSEYLRDNLDLTRRDKIVVGHNPRFNEVVIFFPTSLGSENSNYLIWNYEDDVWSTGALERTAWHYSEVFNGPIATEQETTQISNPTVYAHESGWSANGATRVGGVFAETSPIEIGQGDRLMVVNKLIQDTKSDEPSPSDVLTVTFAPSLHPEGPGMDEETYVMDSERGYTDVRFTARQVKMRFELNRDGPFALGDFRLDIKPGSGR